MLSAFCIKPLVFQGVCDDSGVAARVLVPKRLLSHPDKKLRKADRGVNAQASRTTHPSRPTHYIPWFENSIS
jgi:hypothetical protein